MSCICLPSPGLGLVCSARGGFPVIVGDLLFVCLFVVLSVCTYHDEQHVGEGVHVCNLVRVAAMDNVESSGSLRVIWGYIRLCRESAMKFMHNIKQIRS